MRYTSIERYANEYQLAIIMPNASQFLYEYGFRTQLL